MNAEEFNDVVAHLELVAAHQWPFEIQLRGTGSFRPVSPVVFVALAAGISDCERLESAIRRGPLARALKFNYHPHVTVAHDVSPRSSTGRFSSWPTTRPMFRLPSSGFSSEATTACGVRNGSSRSGCRGTELARGLSGQVSSRTSSGTEMRDKPVSPVR